MKVMKYEERDAFTQWLCDLAREQGWTTFGTREVGIAVEKALDKAGLVINGCVDCSVEQLLLIAKALFNQSAVVQVLRHTRMPDGNLAVPEADETGITSAKAAVSELFKKK